MLSVASSDQNLDHDTSDSEAEGEMLEELESTLKEHDPEFQRSVVTVTSVSLIWLHCALDVSCPVDDVFLSCRHSDGSTRHAHSLCSRTLSRLQFFLQSMARLYQFHLALQW